MGAHLDSVLEGPGLNDNGSGSSAILETALRLPETGISPQNTVRFAFWGAEESGLIGSNEYVAQLTEQEAEDVSLYLNFDMVGSPNFVRFVYDGDVDAFGLVGPEGSDAIEERLSGFFSDRGQFNEPTAFDGRSDYLAFINVPRRAGCSPAPSRSRPRSRPPSTGARRASPTTRTTTRPGTPSRT